jgi:hypothetical protein
MSKSAQAECDRALATALGGTFPDGFVKQRIYSRAATPTSSIFGGLQQLGRKAEHLPSRASWPGCRSMALPRGRILLMAASSRHPISILNNWPSGAARP